MSVRTIIGALLFSAANAQSDGNPHGWDRLRRCDNEDYSPQCGLCEGIGGRVWSDKKDDIKITTCEPVAKAEDLPEEVQKDYPKLPYKFTQHGHYEIMITDKTNIACVGGFPGPDSTKEHCYQSQQGDFIYDWDNKRLKMALNVGGSVSNQTSNITHVNENMWIVNKLVHVVDQCICTQPGADLGIKIYPLNADFMNTTASRFIGRENLYVEYVEKTMLVDHWTQGPHHIWKDVESNQIVRMWQPWNGLEIWHPDSWDFSDNSHEFEIPPHQCVPGSFKWTIKCDKDGYPKKKSEIDEEEAFIQ